MIDRKTPILETERLRLRPLCESDFDDYAALCADPEVARHLLRGTFSREHAWKDLVFLVGHWEVRGYGMWVARQKETGLFVGMAGFANPPGWPGFELAWTLARCWWGNGYATEAARAALAHAFTALRQDRVISLIAPENHASLRVAERLGESLRGRTEIARRELLIYGIDRERSGRHGELEGGDVLREERPHLQQKEILQEPLRPSRAGTNQLA